VIIASYGGDEWVDLARTRAIPSAEAQNAHEVVVVHQPDGNVASCRNEGARQATGDWLCFLDADDELAPGFLAAIERARKQHSIRRPSDRVLYTPAVSYIQNGRRRPPRVHREVPLSSGNWLVIGTVVSREMFFEVGGFRDWPHGLEDWDLWARIWRTADPTIVKVPRAVYVAYWNEDSKHHTLMRDRERYAEAYNRVAASHAEEAMP
jgi:glycosyltransferase involved in cell wall biosynthesis